MSGSRFSCRRLWVALSRMRLRGATRMFLSRSRIQELLDQLFEPGTSDPKCLNQSSYDLRLGPDTYLVGSDAPTRLSPDKPYLTIPPGQFAILTCHESLDLPRQIMGFIALRNKFKMQGLVNISGFHVDPTFKGNLIFAVNNAAPSDIRLKLQEPTFMIFFAEVTGDIGEGRPEQKNPLRGIPLDLVQNLSASTLTLFNIPN